MMNIRTRETINTIMLRLAEFGKVHVPTEAKLADRKLFRRIAREDGVQVRVDMVQDGINLRLRRFSNV